MEDSSAIAFKEWASVCDALREGRHSVLLRKGGIHEGREGFRIEHDEFWLLPTAFHQQPSAMATNVGDHPRRQVVREEVLAGAYLVNLYAKVDRVYEETDLDRVLGLAGLHVLSEDTVRQRFNYREPRLFVISVRVFQAPRATTVNDSAYIAGCRSWVELPSAISTSNLTPVLDDQEFSLKSVELQRRLQC